VEARARTWPLAALALAVLAYAPLLRASGFVPTRYGFEQALFRPAPMPGALLLAIAGWLVWRRRARAAPVRPALALALFACATSASTWAALTRAPDLLFASAAAILLAIGGRAMTLPAVVLLLGLALPPPLEAELVWWLQRASASGAAVLLRALGRDVELGSMILWIGAHQFQVIDGCSGLRGILILSLVALIVRELFASAGAREWIVVGIAPLLGHALNVVRIAWVAAGAHPDDLSGFASDHTPQGIAVLAVGTVALYALGRSLARAHPPDPIPAASTPLRWRGAALALAALAVIPLAVPRFPARRDPAALAFPDARAGWTSEALVADPSFVGTLPVGQFVHRRYVKTSGDGRVHMVELLAVAETPPPLSTSALFSSKLAWPGGGWQLREHRPLPLLPLGREIELSQAVYADGPERALTYLWRARDAGLARESLRSLLALDATPWHRDRPRLVVRLVAPTPQGGPVAYDIAKRTLDVFVSDFRDALAAL
jgi:exosortase/archaeosortase family protein